MLPLIFIDLDGTLVGSSGQVESVVWEALDAASARGQTVALATARGAFGEATEFAKRINPTGWHVFHNGGLVLDLASSSMIQNALTPQEVRMAESLGQENGWISEFYTGTDYAVDSNDALAASHAALLGVPHICRSRQDLDDPESIVRVQYLLPESEAELAVSASRVMGLDARVASSPVLPGVALLSLTSLGTSKLLGIELVAAELNVELSLVMMVGDGLNDVLAMSEVGHPVAMGNADPQVKAVAGHVVAHVDDLGLVSALELSSDL